MVQPRSCWKSWPSRFEPGSSKQRLNHLIPLRCVSALPELIARYAAPGSRPFPSPATLPDAAQQSPLPGTACRPGGSIAEKACWHARPIRFPTTLAPGDFASPAGVVQASRFRPSLATAHEWGHSFYEQGPCPVRTTNLVFAEPLEDATSMGVNESQSLFWECRWRAGEPSRRRWQTSHRPGPDGSGLVVPRPLNPRRPGLNRWRPDEAQLLPPQSFWLRTWSWPC